MPMFKKSGGKIFAVQFNKAEERALDQEIKKQIVENDRAFDMDKESSILWMLHTQFGFGPKRLKLAWKLFYAETLKLREHYLMDQEDDGWLARQKLKGMGVILKNGTEKKEGKPMPKPWENAEGYHDPTAYHGTKNIIRDEDEQQKRVNTLIFVLKYITRLAGFELLNRIEIKDRKTGREYR